MADLIKFKKGLKANLPNLALSEPGYVTDEDRIYIGGLNGNVGMAKKSEVDDTVNKIGDLSTLTTTDKTDLVHSVNEHGVQLNGISYLLKASNIDTTGVNDCKSAVQSFFDTVYNAGGGIIYVPEGTYSFDSSLQYYPDKITLIASKTAIFNFRMTSGYGMLIQPKNPAYQYDNQKHWINGITFKSDNNITLVHSEGKLISSDRYMSSFWTLHNCVFKGGSIGVNIWSNTWCTQIDRCYFCYNGIGLNMSDGGANYGERISLDGCTFDSCTTGIKNYNSQGEIRLVNCSLDYCNIMTDVQNGRIFISSSYIESSVVPGDDYWFKIYSGLLKIENCTLIVMANKTKEIFYVTHDYPYSMNSQQGLVIDGLLYYSSYYTLPFLVKGNGRCVYSNYTSPQDTANIRPLVCRAENMLSYGNCKNNAVLTELSSIGGYNLPTYDSATSSLKFKATNPGDNLGCSILVDCYKHQDSMLYAQLKTAIATGGKRITVEREYLDKNQNNILNNIMPYTGHYSFESDFEGFTTLYNTDFSSRSTDFSADGLYSLKCVLNNIALDSGRFTSAFSQTAGKYYIAIARCKVTSFTSGNLGNNIGSVGLKTTILSQKKITAVTSGWDYIYTYWQAITTDTINLHCGFASAGTTLTGYIDDMYVFCVSDILPSTVDYTNSAGIASCILEIVNNKQFITSDMDWSTLRLNGRIVQSPSGTKYCRFNIKADNMDTASEFYLKDIVINSLK